MGFFRESLVYNNDTIGEAVYNFTEVHIVRTRIVCSKLLLNIVWFCQRLVKLLSK